VLSQEQSQEQCFYWKNINNPELMNSMSFLTSVLIIISNASLGAHDMYLLSLVSRLLIDYTSHIQITSS